MKENPFEDLGFTAYPSFQIPLDIRHLDILGIRATLRTDRNDQGDLYLVNVYWVITRNDHVFTKNKTWVYERSKKTENSRHKIAFDSPDEAIAFAKQNWSKITK